MRDEESLSPHETLWNFSPAESMSCSGVQQLNFAFHRETRKHKLNVITQLKNGVYSRPNSKILMQKKKDGNCRRFFSLRLLSSPFKY